jgi:low affinity Fe/Cu permease
MTTGGRRLSEGRSAVIGIKARKPRLVRGRAAETESETETETASINSHKPLRAGNPSKSYLHIWAGNLESQSCQGQP